MSVVCGAPFCKNIGTNKCAKCVYAPAVYCSRECQVVHWPIHKDQCSGMMPGLVKRDSKKKNISATELSAPMNSGILADLSQQRWKKMWDEGEKAFGKQQYSSAVKYYSFALEATSQQRKHRDLASGENLSVMKFKEFSEEDNIICQIYRNLAISYQKMGQHRIAKRQYLAGIALADEVIGGFERYALNLSRSERLSSSNTETSITSVLVQLLEGLSSLFTGQNTFDSSIPMPILNENSNELVNTLEEMDQVYSRCLREALRLHMTEEELAADRQTSLVAQLSTLSAMSITADASLHDHDRHPIVINALRRMGILREKQQRLNESAEYLKRAFTGIMITKGITDPEAIIVSEDLAEMYAKQGLYDEAEWQARTSYNAITKCVEEAKIQNSAPPSNKLLSDAACSLASTLRLKSMHSAAEQLYQESLDLLALELSEDYMVSMNIVFARCLEGLACARQDNNNIGEETVIMMQQVIKIYGYDTINLEANSMKLAAANYFLSTLHTERQESMLASYHRMEAIRLSKRAMKCVDEATSLTDDQWLLQCFTREAPLPSTPTATSSLTRFASSSAWWKFILFDTRAHAIFITLIVVSVAILVRLEM